MAPRSSLLITTTHSKLTPVLCEREMAAAVEPVEAKNLSTEVLESTVTSVFQPGKLAVELISVDHDTYPTQPIPIMVAAPKDAGTYHVAMLLHGFCLRC